jgi:hypothetical protein
MLGMYARYHHDAVPWLVQIAAHGVPVQWTPIPQVQSNMTGWVGVVPRLHPPLIAHVLFALRGVSQPIALLASQWCYQRYLPQVALVLHPAWDIAVIVQALRCLPLITHGSLRLDTTSCL